MHPSIYLQSVVTVRSVPSGGGNGVGTLTTTTVSILPRLRSRQRLLNLATDGPTPLLEGSSSSTPSLRPTTGGQILWAGLQPDLVDEVKSWAVYGGVDGRTLVCLNCVTGCADVTDGSRIRKKPELRRQLYELQVNEPQGRAGNDFVKEGWGL
ncbi:hypothetical protein Salat_2405700 [Sesamum alatum]|uniref:Uncharacterized protein n=1 Tax=Sesamum alatum TaxID=300844 RepID=A0AAE2CF82_9LAMI|nr:hypothetical protein Salat_2405700 [Sesamum alatum]